MQPNPDPSLDLGPSRDPTGPIAWDRVRDRLPGTAEELLTEIRQAYERSPDEAPRAIERALRARLADLRARFLAAAGSES
jgi:hypothetical protein